MTSPSLRALANQLASLRRQVHAQATASQASLRSIEGGSIDVYDDDDNLIGVIGLQKDGTVGAVVKAGDKPEAPSDPDVQPIPGAAIVAWDGQFEDAQPLNAIERVGVHMSEDPGFVADQDTEFAAIHPTGGTVVIPLDDGADQYVKLVAVSKGGVWSDPSAEVLVAATDAEVAFFQNEYLLTAAGPQDVVLTYEPLPGSEHVYWHPGGQAGLYQREDDFWTGLEQVVSLTDPSGCLAAGDRIVVEYAYKIADVDAEWTVLVPFGDFWKGLAVGGSDGADRSAPTLDDSGWSNIQLPVSNSGQPHTSPSLASWGVPQSSAWPITSRYWLRKVVTVPAGTVGARVSFHADNNQDLYVDGLLAASDNYESTSSVVSVRAFPISPGSHQLAVACFNSNNDNRTWADLQIEVQVTPS